MKSNKEIANHLYQFSELLEASGANPYRVRSYRRAAHVILNLEKPLVILVQEHFNITSLPWIGKGIAEVLNKIIHNNEAPILKIHPEKKSISELKAIPGLGEKRIELLNKKYNITTKKELLKALQSNQLNELKWMNKRLIDAINNEVPVTRPKSFIRLYHAIPIIELLMKHLKELPGVKNIEWAGDLRRKKETFEQIDILIEANQPYKMIQQFINFPEVSDVYTTKSHFISVKLWSGMKVNLHFVSKRSFGSALIHLTGNIIHVQQLEQLALERHYRLTPKGLFKDKNYIAGAHEIDVYQKLDLPFIEPELREGTNEIIKAKKNKLPKLIKPNDIKGDLHSHTTETDGTETLEIMARAAEERGYEYFAITDHSQSLAITNGLDKRRLLQQIKQIDKLNSKLDRILILKSIEVDILEDGSLDLPNEVLKELDIVVCSIHSKFKLPEQRQTERILRAMDNPYFNILGHATGRLIRSRPPYTIDMEKILNKAKDNGCFIELNSQPYRLDINDIYCKMAKEKGVKVAISSDAHSIRGLNFIQWGVYQARRGWLEKKDVLNTYTWDTLKKLLSRN